MDSTKLEWLDMARIDIKNQGNGNNVNVTVLQGENCNVTQPQWFSKDGIGYVLETCDKHLILELACRGAGNLVIRLRGIDRCFQKGNRLPLWVDYTRLAVDDEIIFWEIKPMWHNKSHIYEKKVVDGEKVKVEISWSPHGYKGEELSQLLSLWCAQPKATMGN